MIGAFVYPIRLAVSDAAQVPATPPEVGWFMRMAEPDCAFCQIGCCTQRLLTSLGCDALVIHGPLGDA